MTKVIISFFVLISAINAKSNKQAYMEYLNNKSNKNTVIVHQSSSLEESVEQSDDLTTDIGDQEVELLEAVEIQEEPINIPQPQETFTTPVEQENKPFIRENSVPVVKEPSYMKYNNNSVQDIYGDLQKDNHLRRDNSYRRNQNLIDNSIVFGVAGGIGYLNHDEDITLRKLAKNYSVKLGKNFNDIQATLEYLYNKTRDDQIKRKTYLLNVDKTFYSSRDVDFFAGLSLGQAEQEIGMSEEDSFVYGANFGQRFKFSQNVQAVATLKALKEDFSKNNIDHDYSLNALLGLNFLF